MGDIHVLVRSLRGFERNDVLIKAVRVELRKPIPVVRRRIKVRAVDILPHRGGLGVWVASTKITGNVTLGGKMVRVQLRGGRNSKGSRSDIAAIDRGRVRHPHWGRRSRGNWSNQVVPDGFFRRTAEDSPEWADAIDRAITVAIGEIHA